METSARILKSLLESDGPVSGQDLADRLGLSRTAIWKRMAKLKAEGVIIEAVKGRGYRLPRWPEGLTPSLIAASLETAWLGRPVHYFAETDSTNLRAKALAAAGASHGTLVIADFQSQGRGRLDRSWLSPPGKSLLLSLVLRPELEIGGFFRLTMAAGLSLARAVAETTGLDPRLKWPNDLFLDERKLAGILTEVSGQAQVLDWAVVGLGVNVNAAPALERADHPAVCLAEAAGGEIDRLALLNRFLVHFEAFLEAGLPPEEIRRRWKERSLTLGRRVTVTDRGRRITGLAEDVDVDGALLLRTDEGVRRIVCGDVSLG